MALDPGVRLGPYEIVGPAGAGGMGEVYRARDTRLARTVAIKVLPDALAADPQLRERFEREARAISSLQHPHICTLFDVGREGDHEFLVLEYLEGETLADRLARSGPLPIADALSIAIGVCDALVSAHRAGIVHRDLKPANVMLVRSGGASAPPTAKLLDFGLAKTAAPVVATSGLSMLPTTPPNVTAQGTILGTLQYMAPEQIEGLEADARTDIFAFGALVFEMVTGRTAFEGKTRASLLGAILKDDPPRVSTAQPVAPAALDRIAATCLAKDPDDRYQSARDLLRDLKWVSSGVATTSEAAAPRHARGTIAARWAAAAALGVALITVGAMLARIWLPAPARSTDSVQFTIPPPADTTFATPPGGGTGVAAQLAISPDGRRVVFVGSTQNRFQLWLRSIGSIDARAIPGTDDAIFPFWSPDSQSIGFFANGKLKKVGVAGGPSTVLCDALAGRGGTWNRDNVIVFSPATTGPLMRVSGAGGVPQPAGALDAASSESSQRFPWFLPDGRHFLFTGVVGTCCPAAKPGHIRVGALDSTEAATVLEADSAAVYSDGHLLFAREGTLMAAAFDTSARRFTGDPFPVAELVATEGSRYVSVSASTTGVLVYARAASRQTMRLTWVDRAGRRLGVSGEPATYVNVALSRNERRIAAAILVTRTDSRDVWILDASRGEPSRLTFEAGVSVAPVWSPDDQQIAFAANRNGRPGLRLKRVTGMTQEETLLTSENGGSLTPTHWTADGKYIIFTRTQGTGGSNDIWALPLDGDRKPFAVVATPAVETNGVISPNGRWIAYQSPETAAQTQVLVQPFPPTGGKFQISTAGGFHPVWSTDGKELYFISPDAHMMAVAVKASDSFEHGAPVPLFTLSTTAALGGIGRQFDVTKDGRFLINVLQQESSSLPLTVTLNGMAAIQR